jgi:aminoglycoside phosphotransferase (APT) family kinase protein
MRSGGGDDGESRSAGLDRLRRAVGADGARLVGRLPGGAVCDVTAVELERGRMVERAVLKTFRSDMRDAATFEWESLRTVVSAPVPSPEPLAFDASGDWFGTPAIAMSRLPGRPAWTAGDVPFWTKAIADTLAALHAHTPSVVPTSMTRPPFWAAWEPTSLPGDVAEGVGTVLAGLPGQSWELGLCHGDFHPGNLLFEDGVVTGVVDWVSARWGPLLGDLGRCRAALAVWPGGAAPDLLLEQYVAASGRQVDGLDDWDVLASARTAEDVGGLVAIFGDLGVPLGRAAIRRRSTDFLRRTLLRG